MKIIVGISGASGTHLGVRLANFLSKEHEVSVIISSGAKVVFESEKGFLYANSRISSSNSRICDFLHKNIKVYDEIWQAPASGSALFEAMIIAPCSANCLAKIASGISDNLLLRAAAVMLKEGRKLVLAPRELPFSPISLKQMSELSALGVIIAPPVLGYYNQPKSLEDAENFIIGKWCDALNVENNLFKRWKK